MSQNVKCVKFSWHDCWILLSILNRKEGSKLYEIVGMSDVLNHAIPTEKEMETGLTKGLQAGFISKQGHNFHLTTKFKQINTEILKNKGGLFSLVDKLHNRLKKGNYQKLDDSSIKFIPKEYEKACKQYSEFLDP